MMNMKNHAGNHLKPLKIAKQMAHLNVDINKLLQQSLNH